MYYLFRLFYFLASIRMLSKSWFVFYYLDFFRKPIVFKNLDIAFPQKSKKEKIKIAKETYKNFLTFFEDSVQYNKNLENLNLEIVGKDYLNTAINSQKPVIMMTAHFGNWELVPKIMSEKFNISSAVVMREIENPKINQFFKQIRGDSNVTFINKKRSAKEIIKVLKKEKKVVGILIDQYTRNENAPKINFFKKTVFNPAISKLSKTLNAEVLPVFIYKKENKYILEFKEPKIFDKEKDTIETFTQWQADIIENMIKKYPSQYYWFHNRWKDSEE